MDKQQELALAKAWFESRGISAKITDEDLYIDVECYEVMVSSAEVSYRAELRKEELPAYQD
jgi:hypothetical protein